MSTISNSTDYIRYAQYKNPIEQELFEKAMD